jgi:hypothetical protein
VMNVARAPLAALKATLPPGYAMDIGGSEENVKKVQLESALIALVSIVSILLTLVIQFKHAITPQLDFAAIPYGVSGALVAIVVMGLPFGFTAILGVISLVGVIVSHVIVLFDCIEEKSEQGAPLIEALLDAGTLRLRPVLITVGATVFGLVPLALHGGPLWEPLCYAQIGGLTVATVVTLGLVPILYAVFVLDLGWIRWGEVDAAGYTAVMRPNLVRLPQIKPKAHDFDNAATELLKPKAHHFDNAGTELLKPKAQDFDNAGTELLKPPAQDFDNAATELLSGVGPPRKKR